MKRKTYKYEYLYKKGDKTHGDMAGIKLMDGTKLLVTDAGLTIMYPKRKFGKIFAAQRKDKKREYYSLIFNRTEIKAIQKGFAASFKKIKREI